MDKQRVSSQVISRPNPSLPVMTHPVSSRSRAANVPLSPILERLPPPLQRTGSYASKNITSPPLSPITSRPIQRMSFLDLAPKKTKSVKSKSDSYIHIDEEDLAMSVQFTQTMDQHDVYPCMNSPTRSKSEQALAKLFGPKIAVELLGHSSVLTSSREAIREALQPRSKSEQPMTRMFSKSKDDKNQEHKPKKLVLLEEDTDLENTDSLLELQSPRQKAQKTQKTQPYSISGLRELY